MKAFTIHIILFLTTLSLMATLQSCREEIDIDLTDTIEDLPVELINTSISGQVRNLNGQVIEGAGVQIGEHTGISDQNGYFYFTNIKADKNGTVIIVRKPGYLENRVTVYPSLNHDLFSSIVLTEKNPSATMLSWQGGEVMLAEDVRLYIAPNTLVYESDGTNFEGTATIHYHLFNPDDTLFEQLLPGELTGYHPTGTRVGLVPGALASIEITDEDDRPLRLAQGQQAEFTAALSDRYREEWPDEIQVYRFSPTSNRWLLSGSAFAFDPGQFTGTIPDFGTLCLAMDYDVVKLDGELSYTDDVSTARHRVEIVSGVQKPAIAGQTDEQGHSTVFVPAGTTLDLGIRNECGVVVYEETIAELDDDTEYDKELQPSQDCRNLPVSGMLVNCTGNPVTNGYVRITSEENDLFVRTDDKGHFTGEFKLCKDDTTIELSAFDHNAGLGTYRYLNYPVNEAIEIADWRVCENPDGATGLHFGNRYYFMDDGIDYEFSTSTSLLLYLGNMQDVYMDCLINDFRGEDVYVIPNDLSAEFILTILANSETGPALVPKDSLHLWTYKLYVQRYREGELLEGIIVGFARDENNDNAEGWFHVSFSIPLDK
jgi:hypothetical protein